MSEPSLPDGPRARITALNAHVEALARLVEGHDTESDVLGKALDRIRSDIAALASEVADLDDARARIDELERQVGSLTASRDAVATNLRRLQQRRAVRAALGAVEAASAVTDRIPSRADLAKAARSSARTQRLIERRVRALRPDRGPVTGPVVSIIVPSRDGAHHLRRLLDGLRGRTAYRPFEVIVVDNASTDDTSEVLSEFAELDIRHLRNEQNTSFSHACNQGAAEALGELLLFLNNDTEPINEGWLGALIHALGSNPDAVAVGALLVYPAHRATKGSGAAPPLTVQHRGIAFTWKNGGPRPVNLGTGERPEQRDLTATGSVAAATAACLLVDRKAFEAVGGFDERYVYGWEDVDLCMKLRREGGDILVCGGAALFHHEFGTQDLLGSEVRRMNYLNNSRVFVEQWAPQLRRLYLRDRIRGDRFWAIEGSGSVAITVTDLDKDAGYGDWYTAHELGDALEDLGWTVTYIQRKNDDWYDTGGADVVIMLLPHLDVTRLSEGTFTVAWVRNWVDRWLDNPSFGAVDLVVASTSAFAEQIEAATAHSVEIIPLATNPDRFHPVEPDLALTCDYTFTGSFWGTGRVIERHFDVRPDETFTIYGKGWDKRPRAQRYWRGHLDYDRLPALYSSSKLVIDDTVEPNVPAVNSRVFDALAAGCLVITDNAAGNAEWFDGLLPTYSSRDELRAHLDRFLTDDESRAALIDKARTLVLEQHTYARRAEQFTEAIHRAVDRPEIGFRIGPVTWEYAEQWGDTHFARDMARAMRRRGWRTRITVVSDWDDPREQASDVVVHLRGRTPYATKPGSVNAMWMISHPEEISDTELRKYDLVAVASTHHAGELAARLAVPVVPLLQATSERYLGAERDDDLAVEVLFVGNSRGERRPIVDWAIESGLAVTVFGTGWDDLIPPKYIGGEYFPNERLPDLYRSAGVVLNDHWPDMAAHGFISNRIFDALGAGAPVISDEVPELQELFGGLVVTVASAADLAAAVQDAAGMDMRAGVATIRAHHTFGIRAETLESLLLPHLKQRSTIAGGDPSLAFTSSETQP